MTAAAPSLAQVRDTYQAAHFECSLSGRALLTGEREVNVVTAALLGACAEVQQTFAQLQISSGLCADDLLVWLFRLVRHRYLEVKAST